MCCNLPVGESLDRENSLSVIVSPRSRDSRSRHEPNSASYHLLLIILFVYIYSIDHRFRINSSYCLNNPIRRQLTCTKRAGGSQLLRTKTKPNHSGDNGGDKTNISFCLLACLALLLRLFHQLYYSSLNK